MPQGMTLIAKAKAVQAALVADVTTAWNPKLIHTDPPEMLAEQNTLPVAFVFLSGVQTNEEESTLTTEGVDLDFDLVLRVAKPGQGEGSISLRKQEWAEALRTRLTDGATYHNCNREWLGETYIDDAVRELEAASAWCQVSLRFRVTVEVPAR